MRLVNDENESAPRASSGSSGSVNRLMAVGKGAKIWFEGYVYSLRKKPNPDKGIKYAYWDCAHSGCRVTARTSDADSLEGFTYGRTQSHSHTNFTCGEIIHMEMLEKAKLRVRSQTESIGKIVDDLESEYLKRENFASVKWNRGNMMQVLYRERRANWQSIPKTLDEYDSSDGKARLKNGGKKNEI